MNICNLLEKLKSDGNKSMHTFVLLNNDRFMTEMHSHTKQDYEGRYFAVLSLTFMRWSSLLKHLFLDGTKVFTWHGDRAPQMGASMQRSSKRMSDKAVWCPDVLYLYVNIHRSIHAILGTRVEDIHCNLIIRTHCNGALKPISEPE